MRQNCLLQNCGHMISVKYTKTKHHTTFVHKACQYDKVECAFKLNYVECRLPLFQLIIKNSVINGGSFTSGVVDLAFPIVLEHGD